MKKQKQNHFLIFCILILVVIGITSSLYFRKKYIDYRNSLYIKPQIDNGQGVPTTAPNEKEFCGQQSDCIVIESDEPVYVPAQGWQCVTEKNAKNEKGYSKSINTSLPCFCNETVHRCQEVKPK